MALPLKTDVLGRKNATHLLRRAAFGFSKADVDRFSMFTPQQAVQELFKGVVSPEDGKTYDLPNPLPPINESTGKTWVNTHNHGQDENDLRTFFVKWWTGQMIRPNVDDGIRLSFEVRERLVFFLHTHFTTQQDKVGRSISLYYQNALFRFFSFDKLFQQDWIPEQIEELIIEKEPGEDLTTEERDAIAANKKEREEIQKLIDLRKPEAINFKTLVEKVCLDNAMLKFLDGNQNSKNNPNENFGREFLELYTVGKGLSGSQSFQNELDKLSETSDDDYITFTETDVRAATELFTGYDLDGPYENIDDFTGFPKAVFEEDKHTSSGKMFSNRLGDVEIIPNEDIEDDEERAIDEIRQLVDLVFSKGEATKNVCRKLYRFYVHSEIDDTIDTTVISAMAESFESNGFKLQSLLEELFQSTYFYELPSGKSPVGSLIKSPIDLIASAMNTLKIDLPDDQQEAEDFYLTMEAIKSALVNTGMEVYEPFEVAGYTAYHQYPLYSRSWISTTYLTNRYDFLRKTITDKEYLSFSVVDFVESNFDAAVSSNAKALVVALCQLFLPFSDNLSFETTGSEGELTSIRLNYFLSARLDDVPSGAEGPEEAWNRYWLQKDPLIEGALHKLVGSVLESPEYQLF